MKTKFLLILILIIPVAGALNEGYCVDYYVTDISPSSVGVDEEFTVGIQIENCGAELPEEVVFKLTSVSPYITVKEPLEINIGKLGYANSDRFILYHMKTSDEIVPGSYFFNTRLEYGKKDGLKIKKDGNFSVDVRGEKAKLNIASLKVNPILPYKGDTVEMTLRIENFGKGKAESVRVVSEHPFGGSNQGFIGSLDSGEDGPVVFTFLADKSGNFNFPVKIIYEDDYGTHETVTGVNLDILESKRGFAPFLFLIFIFVLFGGIVYYLIRKNREKDKTIYGLLRNNNTTHKNFRKK